MRVMDDALIQNLPAPTQPSDLDGWTSGDMTAWLPDAIRATGLAEARTDEMRVAVGMVLYRLRSVLGDGQYGEAVSIVATEAGVTVRSLTTWRALAEQRFQLPAPPAQVARQNKLPPARTRRSRPAEALPVAPPDVARTGDTQALGGSAETPHAHGGSPSAAGAVPARGAQQPSGPLPQPTTKQDYRRLVSLLIAAGPSVLATSVGHDELAAARSVLTKALAAEGTPRNPRPAQTGRCSCQPPKPKARQGAAGLMCEGCGALR